MRMPKEPLSKECVESYREKVADLLTRIDKHDEEPLTAIRITYVTTKVGVEYESPAPKRRNR